MGAYFGKEFSGPEFELFGAQHVTVLLILFSLILFLVVLRFLKDQRLNSIVAHAIAWALIVDEILYHIWNLHIGEWTLQKMLPLHLCTIFVWLSAVMLWKKSYRIYEFAFFIGIGGALQAVLTPDIVEYSFPHYRFLQVFISHGCIILASLYMTFVENYRPTLKSLWRVFIAVNIYMVFVFVINLIVGSNYLYLMHKPVTPSALDMMGPWPWYIIAAEAFGMAVFSILYLPFGLYDLRTRWKPGTIKTGY